MEMLELINEMVTLDREVLEMLDGDGGHVELGDNGW